MSEHENTIALPLFQAPAVKEPVYVEPQGGNSDGPDNAGESGGAGGQGSNKRTRNRKPKTGTSAGGPGGSPSGEEVARDGAAGSGEGETSPSRNRRKRSSNAENSPQDGGEQGANSGQNQGQGGEDGARKRTRTRERGNRDRASRPADAGSTRVDQKNRRKDNRGAGYRRSVITEADFLAKREDVDRKMIVRDVDGSQQISILEDSILVEHYVSEQAEASVVGNVYLGKVQNVLPGMEAAFVDIGVGRNGVLYAGEVNWDVSGLLEGDPKRIEQALNKGDKILVQVTKDPIGNKGARLTSQVTFAGRYLVLVPSSGITGISKRLPDRERKRLKDIVAQHTTEDIGIIIRTAAQGVPEEDIIADINRLKKRWAEIDKKSQKSKAPALLFGESNMTRRVVREQFNEDFSELIVSGEETFDGLKSLADEIMPDMAEKISKWAQKKDIFDAYRINEQLAKAFDRKVWLPSGGTLVIDRTEAMTVIDINTGKFTGTSKAASLEETVTANNLEAAEEIVRQLRLRDIGGIIIIDFIDMMLEDNREKVIRRLIECLMRDRTKHQVAEITSLGLIQLTRKRVGQGLIEAFSTTCDHCGGKGYIIHNEPVKKDINSAVEVESPDGWYDQFVSASHELSDGTTIAKIDPADEERREASKKAMAAMAAAAGVSAE